MTRNTGLTLLEVMVAVLVLGLGLTAVAGLFPIAGTIQRRTYDDMAASQMGDSVTSMLRSRGFSSVDLTTVPNTPQGLSYLASLSGYKVVPVPPAVIDGQKSVPVDTTLLEWGLKDRCYPTSMGNDPAYTNRPYYWVPLARKVNATDWQLFVFVLKKEQGFDYGSHTTGTLVSPVANPDDPSSVPVVRSVLVGQVVNNQVTIIDPTGAMLNPSAYFDIGDQVLDSEGIVHKVMSISGNWMSLDPPPTATLASPLPLVAAYVGQLWYGERTAYGSPTRRILTLGDGVVVK